MNTLVLRNDRLDCGTWFFTATAFAVAGIVCLCGLVVMNVRDPKALWMGPSVSYPQGIYLFLDALTLACTTMMAGLAIYKAKKYFDRSEQLILDAAGLRDLRPGGREIPWSQVSKVTAWVLASGGIPSSAQLRLETKKGPMVAVDILGLDQDHKSIHKAAEAMWREAAGNKGIR